MTQNELKNQIQSDAVSKSKIYDNLLINWSTGCGKTLAAIKCINEDLKIHPNIRWYIIVSETTHIKNWYDDIEKFNYQNILLNVEILCYDSLHKLIGKGNFILDEVHRITELRISYIEPLIYKKIIALSATISYEKRALISCLMHNNYKQLIITTKQAINIGLLPKPAVYVHIIELDNLKKDYVYNFKRGNKYKYVNSICEYNKGIKFIEEPKLCFHINLKIKCTQQQYYDLITKEFELLLKSYNAAIANAKSELELDKFNYLKWKFQSKANERKKFLSECKLSKAREVITLIEDKRHICFANSISQCEELANGKPVIHSKLKNPIEMFEKFNNCEINSLYANRMLREGVNLKDIEAGLLVQLDNSSEGLQQILGRILRSQVPEFHLIVVKNTQDEKYFNKVLPTLNEEYIKYV